MGKHKVFISYHHDNDQWYKEELLNINKAYDVFIDASVDTYDIDDSLPNETIRQKIRDEYLKDSTVTIVLVGTETKGRKHIDWEIFSSMYNGKVNKQSGILVINLPSIENDRCTAAHGEEEKRRVYPDISSWATITSRAEYEKKYPYMPARIIDNLLKSNVKISVTNWNDIKSDYNKLGFLIDVTFNDRMSCQYDLSRPMRRKNT